jgi:hypothetical protein
MMKSLIKLKRPLVTGAFLLLLACSLAACGKPTSGILSHSDFAYSADTAEQVSQARARFDRAVQLFQSAGFRAVSSNSLPDRGEAILSGPGGEAQLAFKLPGNGFATITLIYTAEMVGSQAKTGAESLLNRAQTILTPR